MKWIVILLWGGLVGAASAQTQWGVAVGPTWSTVYGYRMQHVSGRPGYHAGLTLRHTFRTAAAVQLWAQVSTRGYQEASGVRYQFHYVELPCLLSLPLGRSVDVLFGPQVSGFVRGRLQLPDHEASELPYRLRPFDAAVVGGLLYRPHPRCHTALRVASGLLPAHPQLGYQHLSAQLSVIVYWAGHHRR